MNYYIISVFIIPTKLCNFCFHVVLNLNLSFTFSYYLDNCICLIHECKSFLYPKIHQQYDHSSASDKCNKRKKIDG